MHRRCHFSERPWKLTKSKTEGYNAPKAIHYNAKCRMKGRFAPNLLTSQSNFVWHQRSSYSRQLIIATFSIALIITQQGQDFSCPYLIVLKSNKSQMSILSASQMSNKINPPIRRSVFHSVSYFITRSVISQIPQGIYFIEKTPFFRTRFFLGAL